MPVLAILPCGTATSKDFLNHLNYMHPVTFSMELDRDHQLPFLDVLVNQWLYNSLGYTVYTKATQTDRYLQAASRHPHSWTEWHPSVRRPAMPRNYNMIGSFIKPMATLCGTISQQQTPDPPRKNITQHTFQISKEPLITSPGYWRNTASTWYANHTTKGCLDLDSIKTDHSWLKNSAVYKIPFLQ
jgi:hypothetical protein